MYGLDMFFDLVSFTIYLRWYGDEPKKVKSVPIGTVIP
jgi:hypothetical protein